MNLRVFEEEGRPAWEELEGLLTRAGSKPERLGIEGILELGRLYRIAVADLAVARRAFPGDTVLDRLEPLTLRARQLVYADRERRGSVRAFFGRDYWRAIRESPRLLGFVLVAMVMPTLLSAIWAVNDPGAAVGLIPSAYRGAAAPQVRHFALGVGAGAGRASLIFTHNIEVTFLVFAGGLLLGFGTIAVLAYNGVLLGTLAGLTIQSGTFATFVTYIVPHGLLELSCFSISGVAGLRLARALIDPGLRARRAALADEARGAVLLIVGTAPWLVAAGLTEGLVTPHGLPDPAALAVGLTLWVLFWGLVWLRGGHPRSLRFARR